jgi:hypothetical protein
MSETETRRSMLRKTGAAVTSGAVGVSALSSSGAAERQPVAIKNVKQINNMEATETYRVDMSERHPETGDRRTQPHLVQLDSDGTVRATEIDGDASVVSPITFEKEDLVENKKKVRVDTKPCAVHNNYTHEFRGVAIEYKQKVNDIGISTAAGIVGGVVASLWSGGLAALMTGVGGLFALISNTDSITTGIVELDRWLYLDPAHKEEIAVGYDAAERGAFEGGYANRPQPDGGHPFR